MRPGPNWKEIEERYGPTLRRALREKPRDPERIPAIMAQLLDLWTENPNLRFWQLISRLQRELPTHSRSDPFYLEDEITERVFSNLLTKEENRDALK